MKKKLLISVAALGLSQFATAQSSVSISGRVEMVLGKANSGTSAVASVPTIKDWRVDGLTSRLIFSGTEDLGGGLKAYFVLDNRFKPDTGAQTSATTFWEGKSILGISGGFGDLYMGRDYIPAFYPGFRVDPFGYDGSVGSIVGQAWAGYTVNGNSRAPNMIGYKTPTFSGVSARIASSRGEGVLPNTNGANIEYAAGPAYAGIATSHTTSQNKATIIAAAYDFGFVRPAAWYSVSRHANGVPGRSIAIAATAPVGSNGVAKFVYHVFDPDTNSGNLNVSAAQGGAVRSKIGLGYEHFLSKRTSLMVAVAVGKQRISTLSSTSAFDVGIRHTF